MTGAAWLMLAVLGTAGCLGFFRGLRAHKRSRALEVDVRELRRRWRRP